MSLDWEYATGSKPPMGRQLQLPTTPTDRAIFGFFFNLLPGSCVLEEDMRSMCSIKQYTNLLETRHIGGKDDIAH